MQSSAPPVDPFAETMRIFAVEDTVPVSRLSPRGEFHTGELAWFEPSEGPPGPATDALVAAETESVCPATSFLIVAGAAALPFVVLALF